MEAGAGAGARGALAALDTAAGGRGGLVAPGTGASWR